MDLGFSHGIPWRHPRFFDRSRREALPGVRTESLPVIRYAADHPEFVSQERGIVAATGATPVHLRVLGAVAADSGGGASRSPRERPGRRPRARCAGAPTAMLLARKGYRVLLIDKATFPSDTISTHIIWPHGAEILHRWGLLDRLAATGCPPGLSHSTARSRPVKWRGCR